MALPRIVEPLTLRGEFARLEPLSLVHADGLAAAARDGDMWQLWYTAIPAPERMLTEIERRLGLQAAGSMLPFTVFDAADRIVGMSTFMNIDAVHQRVEIGSTWYGASAQRTPLNTQCKRLMLSHAFEALQCIAVEFRTHRFNQQSRRAIERLGAQQDGILRNHQRAANGTLRDTVVYSITADEWPTVRTHLDFQLSRPR
ncbi:GNAT family N-acetyltransferase [Aquabacterium sp.]|uniref:GNAT family N-acetyltransferase n=1 Tax=Aquabacterium sp. TaxID=1872578 RepID=UPI002CE24F6B|nr:GNAT family protein [Aquabacterium sp.]HSW06520.1 GNAT family protein [Aquabacterium sp.]